MSRVAQTRWTSAAPRYNRDHLRLRQVAALVNDLKPASMVDLGCGPGRLRSLCPDIAYTGCDFVNPAEGDFAFHRCDFNDQALPDGIAGVELITCSGLLEYIVDLPAFLKQIHDRLRPGGYAVLTYFNYNHLSRCWTMLRGQTLPVHPDWRGLHAPRSVAQMIGASGLRIERTLASSHGFKPSPPVEQTIDWPLTLPEAQPWSWWLAHQFLFVTKRPG